MYIIFLNLRIIEIFLRVMDLHGMNVIQKNMLRQNYQMEYHPGVMTDDSYEYLKNFISIQIKSYVDRNTEFMKMEKISSITSKKKDDYREELQFINKYMANPKVYVFNRKTSTHRYFDLYQNMTRKHDWSE